MVCNRKLHLCVQPRVGLLLLLRRRGRVFTPRPVHPARLCRMHPRCRRYYAPVRELFRTTLGQVYLARNKESGQQVVIKMIERGPAVSKHVETELLIHRQGQGLLPGRAAAQQHGSAAVGQAGGAAGTLHAYLVSAAAPCHPSLAHQAGREAVAGAQR